MLFIVMINAMLWYDILYYKDLLFCRYINDFLFSSRGRRIHFKLLRYLGWDIWCWSEWIWEFDHLSYNETQLGSDVLWKRFHTHWKLRDNLPNRNWYMITILAIYMDPVYILMSMKLSFLLNFRCLEQITDKIKSLVHWIDNWLIIYNISINLYHELLHWLLLFCHSFTLLHQFYQNNPSVIFVRRAGLLWSQRDFEWRWSVPLFKCLTVLEFSFILFDLCLLITFFNFIMNYVPIVTFWIFTYHKIWILSIMFCSIWSYWIIYFLACLEVSWRVVS